MTNWDRLTARGAWAMLVLFTLLSSYLNARRVTLDTSSALEPIVLHASIPVVLLLAGLFAELVALSGVRRVAKVVFVTGLAAVCAVVLIASYLAVLDVIAVWNPHAPRWVNAGLAAVPDIVMVMAGSVILSLRIQRHGLAPAQSRTPAPSRWRRLADAATARVEAAMAVPEKPQVTGLVEGSVEARGGSGAPAADPLTEVGGDTEVDPVVEGRRVLGDPVVNPSTGVGEVSADPPAALSTDSSAEGRGLSADPELASFMDLARRLEDARLVRGKSAQDYARILWAADRGWSPTKIKAEFGFSHATTRRVVEAAGVERPALTVV